MNSKSFLLEIHNLVIPMNFFCLEKLQIKSLFIHPKFKLK